MAHKPVKISQPTDAAAEIVAAAAAAAAKATSDAAIATAKAAADAALAAATVATQTAQATAKAMASTTDVASNLQTHEAVCVERYGFILARFDSTQKILMTFGFLLLAGMAGVIVTLVMKGIS